MDFTGFTAADLLGSPGAQQAFVAATSYSMTTSSSNEIRASFVSAKDITTRRRLQSAESIRGLVDMSALAAAVKVVIEVGFTMEDTVFTTTTQAMTAYSTHFTSNWNNGGFDNIFKATLAKQDPAGSSKFANMGKVINIFSQPTQFRTNPEPTARPTPTPSPTRAPSTAMPTLYRFAPVVTQVTVLSVTKSSLSLTLDIEPTAVYTGTIYCAALPYTTALTTTNQVVGASSAADSLDYSVGTSTATIAVEGLRELTSYNVYCYVNNKLGFGNSLQEVLATKKSFETACCRVVAFTNAPSVVYGDTSKYTAGQQQRYQFVYSLSSAPSSTVTVTPVVLMTNGSAVSTNYLRVLPVSATFASTATALSSSFILSGDAFTAGSFIVRLRVTGASAWQYNNGTGLQIPVTVISDFAPAPPPKLSFARLEDSGGSMFIFFDSATDKARIVSQAWPCNQLFAYDGSRTSTCYWMNNTAVRAIFGAYDPNEKLVEVTSVVQLRGGIVRAACAAGATLSYCNSYQLAAGQNTTVLAPQNALAPVAILTVPTTMNACDNITVDATASTGRVNRAWSSVAWTVTDASGNRVTAVEAALAAKGTDITKRISLSTHMFPGTRYVIALRVGNFFGKFATTSAVFERDVNPNMPQLTIVGASRVVIKPNQAITVRSATALSTCSEKLPISYSWTVTSNNQVVTLQNVGNDVTALSIAANSLTAGNTYAVQLVASVPAGNIWPAAQTSASMRIEVKDGDVVALVYGGTTRKIYIEDYVVIDGSLTYDENFGSPAKSTLTYKWTCAFMDPANFGGDCSSVFQSASTTKSVINVAGSLLDADNIYGFTLTARAPDGRTGRITVFVQQLTDNTATTSIVTTRNSINSNTPLVINGIVGASFAINATWAAYVEGTLQPLTALTPLKRIFSKAEATKGILYPLNIPPNVFTQGITVTFRLTAIYSAALTQNQASICEINVAVNSAPTGGKLTIEPSTGYALSTKFTMLSIEWSDVDMPLSYDFSYIVSPSYPLMSIKPRSSSNGAETELAAGVVALNYVVTIVNNIYDRNLAYSTTNTTAVVTVKPDVDPVAFFVEKATEFTITKDTSAATVALNNVAVSVNRVNCSAASLTYCASLNRQPCALTPQTCSSCLPGFTGRSGSANTLCFNATAPTVAKPKLVGSACNASSECLQGSCVNQVCTIPVKLCPSSSAATCSGHGACVYTNQVGVVLNKVCTEADIYCTAGCSCTDGYGGSDCSLQPSQKLARDATRSSMCQYVIDLVNTLQHSASLLDTVVSSLLLAFDPSEVVSVDSLLVCQTALEKVTALAAEGYLTSAQDSTRGYLADLMSEFITPPPSINGTSRDVNGTKASAQINAATTNIAAAFLNAMVEGQDAQTIITENARYMFRRDLASELINGTISAPASEDEDQYSSGRSGIQLLDEAIQACTGQSGYVGLSLMQWGANPFRRDNGTQVGSAQIKFDNFGGNPDYVRPADNTTIAYYIINQFTEPQDFNFSISLEEALRQQVPNFTFPECTLFNGETYVPCQGCYVSSYTNYNVTFACTDATQLCGGGGTRRLLHGLGPEYAGVHPLARRYLQVTEEDDDSVTLTGSDSIQYAALFEAIRDQFHNVLSRNPFTVDWAKASTVVSFVGMLTFGILAGFFYFNEWDRMDRGYLVYAKLEADREKLKMRHAFMLQKQMEEISATSSKSERDSPLTNAKKMFRISESTYEILVEAFEMEQMQQMNLSKKMTGALSRLSQRTGFELSAKHDGELVNPDKSDRRAMLMKKMKSKHLFESFSEFETDHHLEYNAIFEEEDGMETRDELYVANVVADFLTSVLPEGSAATGRKHWIGLLHRMLKEHDYSAMFYDASLKYPRSYRWLNCCLQVLVNLFIDTIFFGIFYPDNGLCEIYHSENECVTPRNSVLDAPLCQWAEDPNLVGGGSCSLTPPPEDFTFRCVLVVLCQITGLFPAFFFEFILKEFCSRRPDLNKWGFDTVYYLGRSTQMKGNSVEVGVTESRLKDVFHEVEKQREKARQNDLAKLLLSKQEQEARELEEINFITSRLYNEFAYSTEEEAELLLQEVKEFLDEYMDYQTLPWQTSKVSAVRHAKVRAIQQYLGILPDGRASPLTAWETLWYGNAKNKLVASIARARKDAKVITDGLHELGETELMNRDAALMQYFILEQFTPFKQYVLKHRLFQFSVSSAMPLSPTIWFLCWGLIVGAFLFIIYWVLQWGVSNGGVTLEGWGINFAFALLEDIFAVQLLKCYTLFVLSMFSIDPQLKYIYRVLNRVAVSYTQDDLDNNLGEIKVVQHLSGACRVARMKIGADLSTGKILRHIDDVDIEVCRLKQDVGMALVATAIISIPVTVGALDFILGEAALDAAIPAFTSFFLLGNYFIITFGVAILCIPYIVLVCFYLWRHFIVVPAIRHMRALRYEIQHGSFFRSKDRQWRSAKRRERKISFGQYLSSLYHMLRRVFLLAAYYAHSPMLIVADALKLFKSDQQIKDENDEKLWRLMNIDQNMQGMAVDAEGKRTRTEGLAERLQLNSRKSSLREGRNFHLDKLRSVVASLPEPVQELLQEPWTASWNTDPPKTYFKDFMNQRVFNMQPLEDQYFIPSGITEEEIAEQARPLQSTMEVEEFRDVYTSYTNVHTALNRILYTYQRLVADGEAKRVRNKYARYLHQIVDYGECDALIHMSDYLVMLEEVWELYHPAGVPLNAEEKKEVETSFLSWMVSEGYQADFEELDEEDQEWWETYGEKSSEFDTSESAFYANFSSFCEWFKDMIGKIERHRAYEQEIEHERKEVEKAVAEQQAAILAKALAEKEEKRAKAGLPTRNPLTSAERVAEANKKLSQQKQEQQSAVPLGWGPGQVKTTNFGYISSTDSHDDEDEDLGSHAGSGSISGSRAGDVDRPAARRAPPKQLRSIRFTEDSTAAADLKSTNSSAIGYVSSDSSDDAFGMLGSRSLSPLPRVTNTGKEFSRFQSSDSMDKEQS